MPNFKVFSEVPSQLLAQVSNPTAASLLSQVSNSTAASLLSQVSNSTAASLLSQVSNSTAASLLAQVSNSTAASLLAQVSNLTAASLLVQTSLSTTELGTDVADTGDTAFKTAVVQTTLPWENVTFTVRNAGTSNSALARLQLSADSVLFTVDPMTTAQTIAPTNQFFFVPGAFTKYAQIQYASETATLTTSLSIWFQANG